MRFPSAAKTVAYTASLLLAGYGGFAGHAAITAPVAPPAVVAPAPVAAAPATVSPEVDPESADDPEALAPSGHCGVERWAVKTGTDTGAAKIKLAAPPMVTTIARLIALTAPNPLPPSTRVPPVETTVYQLHATLTGFKVENDSDYHLVLSDGTHTMIAELASPSCVKSGPLKAKITAARAEFEKAYSPTPAFTHVNVPVTITGVGFFDFAHGQTGVAPNAIELHPVLNIAFQ